MTIAATVVAMALIACGGGDGNGEPSGFGLYQMEPMGGDPYEINKTVLFHALSQIGEGGECFYNFRILPDADQQVPDEDPFDQYIDVFYGNTLPGSTDSFDSGFVYQNVEYTFSGTPTRSPADPSNEALVVGGTYNSTGESGTFDFILDPNLSKQMPAVTDCVE
jgi:hypothetical protein